MFIFRLYGKMFSWKMHPELSCGYINFLDVNLFALCRNLSLENILGIVLYSEMHAYYMF